jgi:hypothetical protein
VSRRWRWHCHQPSSGNVMRQGRHRRTLPPRHKRRKAKEIPQSRNLHINTANKLCSRTECWRQVIRNMFNMNHIDLLLEFDKFTISSLL